MAASAASGAFPTACAIRNSTRTKAASSRRRSSVSPTMGELIAVCALPGRQEPVHHADPGDPARHRQFQWLSRFRSARLDLLQRSHPARAARRLSARRHQRGSGQRPRRADAVPRAPNYDREFGNGWSISNKFLVQRRRCRHQCAVLGHQSCLARRRAVQQSRPTWAARGCRPDLRPPRSSAAARSPPTQSVIHQGWWFIHKELEQLNNDFRLSKELFDGNTLTRRPVSRLLRRWTTSGRSATRCS